MATGVGVIQILFAQLNSPTPKTLCFVQELGTYLLYKQRYSKFSVKIWQIFVTMATGVVLAKFDWPHLIGRS